VNTPLQRRSLFLSLLLLLGLACATNLRDLSRAGVPRQGWWEQRGPVIPHDTFPSDCGLCHEGDDWTTIRDDFTFDHAAETGTPLEGAHAAAECLRCHNDRGPVAVFAGRGCAGCHEDEHSGKLGRDCSLCHDQDDWGLNELIAQHDRTRFPLVGAHAAVQCWRCHPAAEAGVFTPVDTECATCHASDLAMATDPDHVANGWVSSCDRCHIPTSWGGGGFNHPSFALTGAHQTADCSQCHLGGVFTGLTGDCYSCHAAEYASTTDPNHVALSFPLECEQCHGTSTWQGATFDHSGILDGCYTCHQTEYDATTDPNHVAAGFPTTCESCHTTVTWFGATFDHDFPIDSGDHRNMDCSECHLNPGNFTQFTCISCKDHGQSEMDDEHDGVGGYVYDSLACYSCHPDGDD
jgi:hypothetical protein